MKNCFYGALMGIFFWVYPVMAQEFLLETQPEAPVYQITYTWGDFLSGKSCLYEFNQFQQLAFLSQEQQFLKDKMQTYCVREIGVWNTLSTLFRQNKKALLIDTTLRENGSIMGYLKVLPFYLFDFHNMQPKGLDLFSKLDKIQNALQMKNPDQVILLMQNLSPNEQLFFMPLFNEVNALIDFKDALNGKRGEN